jgi:predicted nucleotide-binding protein (sugar kinase/HSP70/actin superfamily)
MDLQSRKIEFVQEFLKLQSEETISRLEKVLRKDKKETLKKNIQPMSVEQFNKRIDKSMQDSKDGKLTESNDLIAEIEKWN